MILRLIAGLVSLTWLKNIPPEVIANANYGAAPSANYQNLIKEHISASLIDPTSPLFTFDTPRKGYTKEGGAFNTDELFGWRVCGSVNAKNRFGGYTGRVPYFALFKNQRLVKVIVGEIPDRYGISLINSAIEVGCSRSAG